MLKAYTDVDWAEIIDDKKITSSGTFFLGYRLVSWMSKKLESVSLSTIEAEYIVTESCCTQLLQMNKT